MPLHKIYNRVIRCNEALPELPRAHLGKGKVFWEVNFVDSLPQKPKTASWYHSWRLPGGRISMRAARIDRGFLMEFPKVARFRISSKGYQIDACGLSGVERSDLRHLLLDQVIPWSLSLRGMLVLHAGAVLTPRGAIAFVGNPGRGKSTLCASLARTGWPILTDDGVLLEWKRGGLSLVPSYPGLRLWNDSLRAVLHRPATFKHARLSSGKRRLLVSSIKYATPQRPVALIRIYLLQSGTRSGQIRIGRLAASRTFLALLRQTFRLDLTNPERSLREFRVLEALANTAVFRTLQFPRDFKGLSNVRHALLHDIK